VLACRDACANDQEADQAWVYGTEHLVVKVDHALSEQEIVIEKMTESQAKLDAVARSLPREGEAMTAEEVKKLRQVLGL